MYSVYYSNKLVLCCIDDSGIQTCYLGLSLFFENEFLPVKYGTSILLYEIQQYI